MTNTIEVDPYRPERPKTQRFYLMIRQSEQGYWSTGGYFFEDENAAREAGIQEMRSEAWRARDYRVISLELPVMPAPKPPKDD